MDGDITNPGDLHGRVLPAKEVDLCWDCNLINALVGLIWWLRCQGSETRPTMPCGIWLTILYKKLCGSR
jgi:hypothetical protein